MTIPESKKHISISPLEWSTKIFAFVALAILWPAMPQVLESHLNELGFGGMEWEPKILFLGVGGLVVLGLLYNVSLWIGFGQKDGNSWLDRTVSKRNSYVNIFAVIVGLWVIVAILLLFFWRNGLNQPQSLPASLLLFATAFSLSILGLKTQMPQNVKPHGKWLARLTAIVQKKWFALSVIALLAAAIIGLALRYGMLWQGMSGDLTFDLYAAQSLARGAAPFEDYIIMHPPVAYSLEAIAILIGRLARLQDVIAVRSMAVLFIIVSVYLCYRAALAFFNQRAAALISAGLLVWSALISTTNFVSPVKCVVVLFTLLLVRAIQLDKWTWAGITIVLLTLSWGGALVFSPIPIAVLLLNREETKFKNLRNLLIGMGAILVVLTAYLAITGTTTIFFQQYMGGLFMILKGKLHPATSIFTEVSTADVSLFSRLGRLPLLDQILLVVGLISLVIFFIQNNVLSRKWMQQLIMIGGDRQRAPVWMAFLAVIALDLVDLQSFIDIIPIIPVASILTGWLISRVLIPTSKASPVNSVVWRMIYVAVFLFGLFAVRFADPVPSFPVTLNEQKLASDWLALNSQPDEHWQFLGDLSPLVLNHRKNATRVIHLGPKSVLALQAEGQSLNAFSDALLADPPDMIFTDRRNAVQPYLADFFGALRDRYSSVQTIGNRGQYGDIYFLNKDPKDILIAAGMQIALDSPEFFLGELAYAAHDYAVADEYYKQSTQFSRQWVNLVLIRRGYIYLAQGNEKRGMEFLKAASNRGKYPVWGNLELASLSMTREQPDVALQYLQEVFGEKVPAGLLNNPPKLFGLVELKTLSSQSPIFLDELHQLLRIDLRTLNPDDELLTVWWWTPDAFTPETGQVVIQWLKDPGDLAGPITNEETFFYPGAGVRWSYLLPNQNIESYPFFRIGIVTDDDQVVYSAPISLESLDAGGSQ